MKSIQIDLSHAGESECDRAEGWGFRGQSSDKGQRRRAKNKLRALYGPGVEG